MFFSRVFLHRSSCTESLFIVNAPFVREGCESAKPGSLPLGTAFALTVLSHRTSQESSIIACFICVSGSEAHVRVSERGATE